MVKNKEKHQVAFCVSAVVFCIGLSLVADAIIAHSAMSLVVGGVLTVLSILQAMESYSFLQKSEKPVKKFTDSFTNGVCGGEPEITLLVEKILQPFAELYGRFSAN
ncbi:MAG: hypothetical protein PG981_001222 [Wolbachia endosymbiont of Ctenocephalides orientis wCori]|nr:MAG: hypothetical protein PG981_001222 [Wolbachia endosymbiont of Ctenocephalides orientis wCori]